MGLLYILVLVIAIYGTWYYTSNSIRERFAKKEYIKVLARGSLMPIYRDLDKLINSLSNNDSTLFNDALHDLRNDLVYLKYYGEYLKDLGFENNISGIVELMNKMIDRFENKGFDHIHELYLDNTEFYTSLMTIYNAFKNRAYEVTETGIDAYSDLFIIHAIENLLNSMS